MNISKTSIANPQLTISIPKVDTKSVVDTTWNAIDSFETLASRTGGALGSGIVGAVPFMGYKFSKYVRENFQGSRIAPNSINELSNAVTGLSQMAGIAAGAAAAVTGFAGMPIAGNLFKATIGCFGLAGLSATITAYSTNGLGDVTNSFVS